MAIRSTPSGAQVWLGDTKIGVTPYADTQDKQKEKRTFVLRHPGCQDHRIKLRGNRDESKRITLACE